MFIIIRFFSSHLIDTAQNVPEDVEVLCTRVGLGWGWVSTGLSLLSAALGSRQPGHLSFGFCCMK